MVSRCHIHHIRNSSISIYQEWKVIPLITRIHEYLSISLHIHNKTDTHIYMSYGCIPNFSLLHFYIYCIVYNWVSIRKILIEMGHIVLHGSWKNIFYNKLFCIFSNVDFFMDHSHLKHRYILNLDRFFYYLIPWLHYTVKFS